MNRIRRNNLQCVIDQLEDLRKAWSILKKKKRNAGTTYLKTSKAEKGTRS